MTDTDSATQAAATVNFQACALESNGVVTVRWSGLDAAQAPDGFVIVAKPSMSKHDPDSQTAESVCTITDLEPGVPYTFTVSAPGTSYTKDTNSVTVPLKEPGDWWMTSSVIVVFLWIIAGAFFVIAAVAGHRKGSSWDQGDVWYSLAIASGFMCIASLVLILTGSKFGVWSVIVGHDRRISTSKTQFFIWTVLIAFVIVYFASRTLIGGESGLFKFDSAANSTTGDMWSDYLILLGGPFAALVFAKGIVNASVNKGSLQKTVTDDGSATMTQALTKDDGNPDLVDTQYLIFNLVALAYVIIGLAATNDLPQIPSLILVLTSPAAATYVINKGLQANTPTVSSVVPSRITVGSTAVVSGANFMPGGTKVAPTVTIGGIQALVDTAQSSDTRLVVTPGEIPNATAGTIWPLVVTTAARISTESKPVQIDPA